MKLFFEMLNESKSMIHYQNFMQKLHQDIYTYQHESKNDISKIAKNYAKKIRILCIDELEIKDIADAMIL